MKKAAVDRQNLPDNAFWQWSLETYERNDVAQTLLNLQDHYDININLVIWLLWPDKNSIEAQHLETAQNAISSINDQYTRPLRHLRRTLKGVPGQEARRQHIKQAELLSERWQHHILFTLTKPPTKTSPIAAIDLFETHLLRGRKGLTKAQIAAAREEFDLLVKLVAL